MHKTRTILLAVFFLTLSASAFARDPDSWRGAPGPSTMQMQLNASSSDPSRDPYRRDYRHSEPDYTCPRQSVVMGMPNNVEAARQQPTDPASHERTADLSPAIAAPSSQDAAPAQAPDANPPKPYAILTCGTFVRLEFTAQVSSKSAQVGDSLTLRVIEDIKVGNTVIVPRGTVADGNVTFVRRTGPGGMPGALAYQLNALHVNGTSVPLWQLEARSGDPRVSGAEMLIPVAGAFTVFRHGKDVELKPGMPVTAFVAADTKLSLPY